MALRDAVLDEGSFVSWDSPPLDVGADAQYRRELADARAATGLDESVLTGEGTFVPGPGASPAVGAPGRLRRSDRSGHRATSVAGRCTRRTAET